MRMLILVSIAICSLVVSVAIKTEIFMPVALDTALLAHSEIPLAGYKSY